MEEKNTKKKIKITVVTPEGKVFEGNVDFISIPAKSGSLGILPRHVPLIAQLKTGILKVVDDSNTTLIGVCRGYFEFIGDKANVLTERAVITTSDKKEETLEEFKKKHDITQEITEETRKVAGAIAKMKTLRH
ncbi:MAG: ATP synthase F1 subunit epsilon [Actinobacteria bacterium]|nr:ATP synthase F1 subunit epsilon [Actinomycetota bacterium]